MLAVSEARHRPKIYSQEAEIDEYQLVHITINFEFEV